MRALIRRRPEGEEGSFTVAVVIWILIFLSLLTLIIDGSMEITADQRAANIADSIARNVANDINTAVLQKTGAVEIEDTANDADIGTGTAGVCLQSDIDQVLGALPQDSNVTVKPGNCTVNNGKTVTVIVTLAYTPLVWGSGATATASATAAAVTAPTN